MQKWYILMAKSGQEHSSMSLLGQAKIETYYPEVKECFRGETSLSSFKPVSRLFFARFDYEREYRVICYSRGVRKVVAFGQIPAEVDPSLLREIQDLKTRCRTSADF